MIYDKIFVRTSCPTTIGISSDMSKFWSANGWRPTVICSPAIRWLTKKERKKKNRKMPFWLTNVLVTDFKVNLTGLLERESNVTKLCWGDQCVVHTYISYFWLYVCIYVCILAFTTESHSKILELPLLFFMLWWMLLLNPWNFNLENKKERSTKIIYFI